MVTQVNLRPQGLFLLLYVYGITYFSIVGKSRIFYLCTFLGNPRPQAEGRKVQKNSNIYTEKKFFLSTKKKKLYLKYEKKIIGLAILAAAALWIFRKVTAALKLEYRIKGARINFYTDSLRITTDLELTNFSRNYINLEAVTGTLSINGKPVATINQVLEISIRPGITVLPLNFEIKLIDLRQLAFIDRSKLKFNFTGSLKAEGLKIPIFYNYDS